MKPNKNKRINILLAIILAFSGWVYVLYMVDPMTTRTFKDVPITYLNEDSLETRGIAYKSANATTIEVTVKANRSVLNDLASGGISAEVDLGDAGEGENTLELKVQVPSGVYIESKSMSSIVVNTEAIDEKLVPARVEYSTDSVDTEPMVDGGEEPEFSVRGAKSLVESVEYVRLPIDGTKTSEEAKTFSVRAVAIDDKGDPVTHLTVTPNKASVSVVDSKLKTVPLKVKVKNPKNDNYKRTYTAPDIVTIKGSAEALELIENVSTEPVDLSDMTESGTRRLTFALPDGVQVANASRNMSMTVKVSKYQSKDITVDADDIQLQNLGSKYDASIEPASLTIEVTDTAKNLKSVTPADFTVTVDAKGLSDGSYEVTPKVEPTVDLHKAELKEPEVVLNINEKA